MQESDNEKYLRFSRDKYKYNSFALTELIKIGVAINSSLNEKEVIKSITEGTTKLLDCEAATIYLIDHESNSMNFFVVKSSISNADVLEKMTIPIGKGISGWCAKNDKPIIVNDVTNDKRFYSAADKKSGFKTKSVICVPIHSNNLIVGVLQALNSFKKTGFDDNDQVILEHLANQAVIAIDNSRMYQELLLQREKANREAKSKSEFLANMSHEIRTPLNAVIGFTDLLLKTPLTHQQQEFAKIINNSGQSLLAIINDILDFSKIESGKLVFEPTAVNLNELAQEAIDTLKVHAIKKKIQLFFSCSNDLFPWVIIDPLRLKQVLVNLLSNAIKFTANNGKVILEICQTKIKSDAVTINFSVCDTGIGISKIDQQKLFKAFSQVDNSATRKFGGTGLGLIISNNLVKAMGGQIKLKSEVGVGSKFYFCLEMPIVKDISIIRKGQNSQTERKLQPLKECKPVILVAEDTETNVLLIDNILKEIFAEIDLFFADNGAKAVEICKEQKIDLVLMDVQMPVMDGVEATKRLRQLGFKLPIIALTAGALEQERKKCLDAGMDFFISKPVHYEHLIKVLEQFLTKKSSLEPETDIIQSTQESLSDELSFDKKSLLIRIDHNHELLKILLQGFPDIQKNAQDLFDIFPKKNADLLRKAAHKLKGSALNMSFLRLAKLSKTFEYSVMKDFAQAKLMIDEIQKEIEKLKQIVKNELEST